MNSLIRILFVVFSFVAFCIHAGSFFSASSQGIGVKRYAVSVRGTGMGGTGLASADSIALTNYSISKWRRINETRATVGIQYFKFNTELNGLNFTTSTSNIGDLHLAIPLKSHKLLVGISITPYSNVDFKYIMAIQDQGKTYDESVFQKGSISKAQFAIIWSPVSKIGISLNGNYYFGTIKDLYRLRFSNSNYYDSYHEIEYQIKGPGLGVSFDLRATKDLLFAGFVDFKPSIDLIRNMNSALSQAQTELTNSASFPLHFGFGSSYKINSRLNIAIDYSGQNWSEGFGLDQLKETGSDPLTRSRLDDWYQLGIGIERNAHISRRSMFLDKLDFRTGFSVRGLGYRFNNEPVLQYAGHFGIGVPFSNSDRFDFAIAIGVRGDKSKNLAEEKFVNFEVSVTMGELWYQKLR